MLTKENGRDYASVDEAVDRLFTDIMTRLRKIKPDIAIEFRQPYNGPLMRKYGNMLRGVDCPNAGPVNRKEIVDLRLLADHTAVHSDMFIWHPDEPLESAALQILNVIFSVPQVSVRLTEIPPAHREMIGFWMKYWRENRGVLLDGEFIPVSPAQNYPMVSGRTANKWISVIYQDIVVAPGGNAPAAIDVINAKPGGNVVPRLDKAFGMAAITVRDCRGQTVRSETRELSAVPTCSRCLLPAGEWHRMIMRSSCRCDASQCHKPVRNQHRCVGFIPEYELDTPVDDKAGIWIDVIRGIPHSVVMGGGEASVIIMR